MSPGTISHLCTSELVMPFIIHDLQCHSAYVSAKYEFARSQIETLTNQTSSRFPPQLSEPNRMQVPQSEAGDTRPVSQSIAFHETHEQEITNLHRGSRSRPATERTAPV